MTLLTNCKVYTMCGQVFEKGFVLISDGKIKEVGDMAKIGNYDAQVIDLEGGYLLPGLIDAHSHIGLFNEGIRFEGEDGNEDTDPITPQLRAIDGIYALDRAFEEALHEGVTSVVTGPGSANPIAGRSTAIKTRGICVDDMVISPICAMKFALGENPKMTYNGKDRTPVTRMATAALIRETLFKTMEYIDKKEDPDSESDFDFKYEALIPVIKGEIPAHFHVHRADDIFTALRISKEFNLKCVLVHCTDGHKIADRLAQEKAPIIVGPVLTTRCKPELAGQDISNAAKLVKAGNQVALCTDYPEVDQGHLMLSAALAAKEGLTDEQAFEMITINAAKIAGIDDRVGSIQVGKDADIVVYDGHPFDVRTKVAGVYIQGEKIK